MTYREFLGSNKQAVWMHHFLSAADRDKNAKKTYWCFTLLLNPFPDKPCFLPAWSTSPLKTLWEKEKLLVTSNFSFSHSVYYLYGEVSAIFIKFEIVVCKLFSVWSSLKFVVWESVNFTKELLANKTNSDCMATHPPPKGYCLQHDFRECRVKPMRRSLTSNFLFFIDLKFPFSEPTRLGVVYCIKWTSAAIIGDYRPHVQTLPRCFYHSLLS